MEKRIKINGLETPFWIEDTGRLRNEKTKRYLKGGINKGYHLYSLWFKGRNYTLYTHRLVAEYFIPNPNNLPIVHHKDGNKLNNIFSNLEWVSAQEHNETIQNLKQNSNIKRPLIKIEDLQQYGEMAQFRNSPYYATKDGKIINISKKIEMNLEKSGNYLRFQGNYNLNHNHFLVHRVVYEAFNGPIPEGYDIDHIDGNPYNNALNNLQAISHTENLKKRNMNYDYAKNNFNYEK